MPTPEWKKRQLKEMWYPGDTINLSIGQGYLLVTPLDMYRVVSSIATRGEVYKPHVLKKVLNSKREVVREVAPVLQDRIELRNETWESLIRGMEKVVNSGTGRVCRGFRLNWQRKPVRLKILKERIIPGFRGFFLLLILK